MALCLKQLNIIPQYILGSPAKRALTTARIFSDILLNQPEPDTDDSIYDASVEALMHVVRRLDDRHQNVMLVGHNPGMTQLHNLLVADKVENIPTCGISVIQLDIDNWQALQEKTGRLLRYEYPKKSPAC